KNGPLRTTLINGTTETTYNSGFSIERGNDGKIDQYADGKGNVFTNQDGKFKDKNGDVLTADDPNQDAGPHDRGGDNGPVSWLVKNSQGQVSETIYSNGDSRQFGYDASGKLDQITYQGQVLKLQDGQWTIQPGSSHAQGNDPFGGVLNSLGAEVGGAGGSGDSSSGKPATPKPVPAGISDVSLDQYGQLKYNTQDGTSVDVSPDGSSMSQKKDGTWVNSDANGKVNSIVYSDGKYSSFGYDQNGTLDSVDQNGTTYYRDTNGDNTDWKTSNGATATRTGFSVSPDGIVSSTDMTTGQVQYSYTDGGSMVAYSDGSTVKKNAQGQVTQVETTGATDQPTPRSTGGSGMKVEGKQTADSNGKDGSSSAGGTQPGAPAPDGPEAFQYDNQGLSQYTNSKGDTFKRQGDGSFVDGAGQVIKNVNVSSDGTV
ncbi:MAG: hypothetical protein ACRD3W_09895, partial [Terriglobales bacterium]